MGVDNIRAEMAGVALEQRQINAVDYLDLPYGQGFDHSEGREGPSEGTTGMRQGNPLKKEPDKK